MQIHKLKNTLPRGAEHLKGTFLKPTDIDLVVTEDCDAYDMHGKLLFRYRKNAIPFELLRGGYLAFKDSIELTDGRGIASGSSHKRIRQDGSVSNITIGNKVFSGNVGYMDAGAMVHYCRKTAFARDYFEQFKKEIFYDLGKEETCVERMVELWGENICLPIVKENGRKDVKIMWNKINSKQTELF